MRMVWSLGEIECFPSDASCVWYMDHVMDLREHLSLRTSREALSGRKYSEALRVAAFNPVQEPSLSTWERGLLRREVTSSCWKGRNACTSHLKQATPPRQNNDSISPIVGGGWL